VRVDELLRTGGTRSFEYFPPKSADEENVLNATLRELEPLRPSFVSVTYRGGTESRQRTFDLVSRIQHDSAIPAMAHLICVGHTETELREILATYQRDGVVNLMALGGDRPDDPALAGGSFHYAQSLVELARECGEFSIGVAAHPNGHPRSTSRKDDRRYLAAKLRIADFAVTQFFFSANEWTTLVDELGELGVTKPVLPGIIPVTTLGGVQRMTAMGGFVPPALVERLERAHATGGAPATRREGIAAATELCRELLELGAPGIHFYTMNRSAATSELFHQIDAS
jgi:methylenetetrahydrofolate reductase (NADPH)